MITARKSGKNEFLLTEFKLSIIGLPYIILITIIAVVVYLAVWDYDSLHWGVRHFFSLVCIPVVITGLFLNEFFHRLTLAVFCKFPMSRFWYGFNIYQLMKCGGREIPSGIKYYRLAIIIPHLLTGLIPLIVGITIKYPTIYIFGYLFTLAAVGDLVLLWESRHVDSKKTVSEHPTEDGIMVVSENE